MADEPVRWLRLKPKARKWVLSAHLISSVGWIGLELAMLSLSVTALVSDDVGVVDAARRIAGLLGGTYYFPVSLIALVSGLWLGLGTRWGLIRNWWVAIKLVLTIALFAGGNLAVIPEFEKAADAAARGIPATEGTMFASAMSVGMTLLIIQTMLSVFKPGGRIRKRVVAPRRERVAVPS